jgi:GNAT superfamily N-acetyltransferase
LAEPHTIVAEQNGDLLGFAHTILNEDRKWGALLENLHVPHDHKRKGIGTGLLAETAQLVLDASPPTGLYLWVLEQNKPAQAFYQALGGTCAGKKRAGPFPGGGTAVTLRYAWPDPEALTSKR